MNDATVDALVALNERFYAAQAKSFSDTRRGSWPGWERCLPYLHNAMREGASRCRLLDVACGNLRFEAFLRNRLPQMPFEVRAVDSCAPLAGAFALPHADGDAAARSAAPASGGASADAGGRDDAARAVPGRAAARAVPERAPADTVPFDVRFCELDVIDALRRGHAAAAENPFDVAVAFGFMHHVPTARLRARLLRELVRSVRPGGVVIASFWGFLRDSRLREKALRSRERALADVGLAPDELDKGDFILGWQHERAAYRYCHSFDPREVDELVRAVADCSRVEARFFADGRTGTLNEYAVLRRS